MLTTKVDITHSAWTPSQCNVQTIHIAGDAHCPRQYGVYPSSIPGECDTYYTCTNGKSAPTKCAEGLHYSDESGICVWARDSGRWQNRLLALLKPFSIHDRSPLSALLPGMTVTLQQQSQSGRRKKGAPQCRRRSPTESQLRNWQMGSSVQADPSECIPPCPILTTVVSTMFASMDLTPLMLAVLLGRCSIQRSNSATCPLMLMVSPHITPCSFLCCFAKSWLTLQI